MCQKLASFLKGLWLQAKSSPAIFMAGILLLPVLQEPEPRATVVGMRILKFIAVAGGVVLLAKTYFGDKSIGEAKGWDALWIPVQRFAGAGLALFFALDLVAEGLLGSSLFNLILEFLR